MHFGAGNSRMAPKCADGGSAYGGGEDGIVDARRATVVAFYGGLPDALDELVARLQDRAAAHLGSAFAARARGPGARHGHRAGDRTDPRRPGPQPVRRRAAAGPPRRDVRRAPAGHPVRRRRARGRRWPSRGASRYERSFLCGPADVVLIGWPVGPAGGETVPLPTLATIRRGCEPFGARHRYHVEPGSAGPGRLPGHRPAHRPARAGRGRPRGRRPAASWRPPRCGSGWVPSS